MCWSIPVTTTFASIYLLVIIGTLIVRPKKYAGFVLYLSFFFIMETFQLFQWVFGDVVMIASDRLTCSERNRHFTYVGFILIWLQPLLFTVIGFINNRKNKKVFAKLATVYIFFFAAVFIIFLLQDLGTHRYNYELADANIGNKTCTFIGKHHHLAWTFYGGHPDYHPNNLMYVVLCTIPFMFYGKEMYGAWISWLITLLITLVSMKWSFAELPAYWCFLSVISIPVLACQGLYTYLKNKKKRKIIKYNV